MKFGYEFVPDIISEDVAHIVSSHISDVSLIRGKGFPSAEHELTLNVNSSPVLHTLIVMLKPRMEQITSKELIPTYYYSRVYLNGSDMFEHLDRPECEYSVTINLGQSDPYPFYIMNAETNEYDEIYMEPGNGVVYKGCELKHYRPEFTGTWYNQIFLHYVTDPIDKKLLPNTKELREATHTNWKEKL